MFSLVTNACAFDAARLRLVIPSWQRTFGTRFDELVVVLDTEPPVGRIASLHGDVTTNDLAEVRDVLDDLARSDPRIRIETLPGAEGLKATADRWFTEGRPMRCQSGTPILAFARAIDSATRNPIVLRVDCDMLFFDDGWLDEAVDLLIAGEVDLVEPWGVGELNNEAIWISTWVPKKVLRRVSTRAMLLHAAHFAERCLPIRPHRLDVVRRIHRKLQGSSTWLALEAMLDCEVSEGRVRHRVLPSGSGSSMHVCTRAEASLVGMAEVAAAFERGDIPEDQVRAGRNFAVSAWKPLLSDV
jgi:hypothetical protein